MYEYKILDSKFANEIVVLTKAVFDSQVASQYSQEGVEEFYKYITSQSLKDRLDNHHLLIGSFDKDKLIAILEIRNNNHISLFFVDGKYQGIGIGREMFKFYLNMTENDQKFRQEISVNSSPNSVLFYEKLGFKKVGLEKEKHGIRYNPMIYKIPTKPTLTSFS